MEEEIILGIDLGTTNSAIAFFHQNRVEIIPNALGEKLTPSVVAYDDKYKKLTVGRVAKDILAIHPKKAAALFKRDMGSDKSYELNGRKYTAEELSGFVLMSLKNDAEAHLGHPISRCIITVPAYFNEDQRRMTKNAGEFAGLQVERILNEPTAAAIAYGMQNLEAETRFLVFDLGGGTFDVCIMELFEGVLEVVSVAGDSRLGGEDFTLRLCEYALEQSGLKLNQVRQSDPDAFALFYKRAELAKRKLAETDTATIKLPIFNKINNPETTVTIQDSDCDNIFKDLLQRMIGPCRSALRGANLSRDEIEHIILGGGATRMGAVQRLIKEVFGVHPKAHLDPDLCVVEGAAIQAGLLMEHKDLSEIVVTDILSHSLGVEVSKELGANYVSGFFDPIIHRNTVIPVSRSKTYTPIDRVQQGLTFSVYEGESRLVKDNKKIGELDIKLPSSGDREVEVRFTYDLDGILDVEATILQTGKILNKTFIRSKKKLTEKELKKAQERIQELKKDPLDRPEIRALISKAELLYKELTQDYRETLSDLIIILENAAKERDNEKLEEAYQELLEFCNRFGEESW